MAETASTMLPLGTEAFDFHLPDIDGKIVSRDDFRNSTAFLVVFMCNHCPYVKHIRNHFTQFAAEYQNRGVGIVGINSNDAESFPEDSPENMKRVAEETGYTFPYLYDQSQEVAKAYRAACTPDFFLFDRNMKLVYRGQMDASRPGNSFPVTGEDIRAAADAAIEGKPQAAEQRPSLGCNIKWRAGNEPDYYR